MASGRFRDVGLYRYFLRVYVFPVMCIKKEKKRKKNTHKTDYLHEPALNTTLPVLCGYSWCKNYDDTRSEYQLLFPQGIVLDWN